MDRASRSFIWTGAAVVLFVLGILTAHGSFVVPAVFTLVFFILAFISCVEGVLDGLKGRHVPGREGMAWTGVVVNGLGGLALFAFVALLLLAIKTFT